MLVNALFLQLAAFTDGPKGFSVVEGNAIASYMALAIQLGNVVTIVYCFLGRRIKWDLRRVMMYILGLQLLATVFLSFFWDKQVKLFGQNISITLLSAAFASGAVGSMSNLTFWPFAVRYCPSMTAAMALGTSFSNILPSIVAALQLPGPDPRFSPTVFFLVTAFFIFIACCSFAVIAWTKYASAALPSAFMMTAPLLPKKLSIDSSYENSEKISNSQSCSPTTSTSSSSIPISDNQPEEVVSQIDKSKSQGQRQTEEDACVRKINEKVSNGHGIDHAGIGPLSAPVILQLWSCMMYFYLPGIQTFLVKGFVEKGKVLLWFTIVDKCVGVLGRCTASRSRALVGPEMCCVIQTMCFVSIFIFGWPLNLSPIFLIISSGIHSMLYSYTNTLLYLDNVRTIKDKSRAKAMSEWLGISQQAGASIGTGIAFLQTILGVFN